MKHEQPPDSVGVDGSAASPKSHAPVRAGRVVILLSVVALGVAATGIFDRRHAEERLARWTNEQAIPTVALVSARRGGDAREVVLPGDVEAFYQRLYSRPDERLCSRVAQRHRRKGS